MMRRLSDFARRTWTLAVNALVSKSDLWFGALLVLVIAAILATMWRSNDEAIERMAVSLDPDRAVACYYLEHVNGDITPLGCVKYGSAINEQTPR